MGNKKNGLSNLAQKAALIFGAAVAALTGVEANSIANSQLLSIEGTTIELQSSRKVKPMPLMKIKSITDMSANQFVASHRSHSSHSSHSSHRSHYSSYNR